MKIAKFIFISMRPGQWPKNLIIFAAIFFGQGFDNTSILLKGIMIFAIYCMLSSAMYIINDIFDIRSDKQHPQKSKRPIASGNLDVKIAIFTVLILLTMGLIWSFCIKIELFAITVIFLSLNILYDIFLKHIVILDVFTIAFSFILRLLAGASVVDLEPSVSSWILLCTVLLSLFLALCKRRSEMRTLVEKSSYHRKSLSGYNQVYLDQLIAIVSGCTILSYSLYTLSPDTIAKHGTNSLKFTIPFVIYGIFRYLHLVYLKEAGLNPERILLKDKPFIINLLLYVACIYYVLYLV